MSSSALRSKLITATKKHEISLRKLEKLTGVSYITLFKFISKGAKISAKTEEKLTDFVSDLPEYLASIPSTQMLTIGGKTFKATFCPVK